MAETITQKDFLNMKKEIDRVREEDTTPYAGIVDGEVVVMGDPNNTKVEPKDYKARFIMPEGIAPDVPNAKRKGGYVIFEVEYKDVFVDNRNNLKYTSAMATLMPFVNHLAEDGSVDNMTEEEATKFFSEFKSEYVDALFNIAQTVLGIDDNLIGWLAPSSALELVTQIIRDFPSVLNQADLFFGSPTERA